jgi:hypothetical protein
VEGVNSNMIYCKNFCKCHNIPPPSTIKSKKIKIVHYILIQELQLMNINSHFIPTFSHWLSLLLRICKEKQQSQPRNDLRKVFVFRETLKSWKDHKIGVWHIYSRSVLRYSASLGSYILDLYMENGSSNV